ncbi:MAG: low temperature requirement protein A [Candidatus Limnocylindria bacterium]
MRAPEPQPVTFVELFFDLVFVFAVTQVTVLTAHDLTVGGVLRSLLLFWLIWWAWTQFTWTLNPADTTHSAVRLVTLVATGIAFVMATMVPHAFEEDAIWFAIPYVLVRVLGLGLQVRMDTDHEGSGQRGVLTWTAFSAIGLVLVLVGALLDPGIRTWFWLLAIAADLGAAAVAGRAAVWELDPPHISERHGLFVIIALGESLIVAGTAVAGEIRTDALIGVAAVALVIAGLMWWSYFGWLQKSLEHAFVAAPPDRFGPIARDAFSLAHFPLICGIVGFAVAVEEMVAHPDEPVSGSVIAALGVGVALFVGFSAVSYWVLHRRILVIRAVALGAMLVALAIVAPLAPIWPLAVVASAMLVIVAIESRREPGAARPVSPG